MAFRSDVEALVLGALQDGALHGYGIAKRLRGTSKALAIGEGQLYPVLHRMESEGLLAADWVDQPGKPDRKTYTLTESGRAALTKSRAEWKEFAAGVGSVLGGPKLSEGGCGA